MPLVSGTTWFPSDSGDALPQRPRRPSPDRPTGPSQATLIPGPLPSGALGWHVEQRGRLQPRPWQPSAEFPTGAWPTLSSTAQTLAWQGPQDAIRQAPTRARQAAGLESPALLLGPPEPPQVAWQGSSEGVRRRGLPRRRGRPDDTAAVPSLTWGALPSLAWVTSQETRAPAACRAGARPSGEAVPAPLAPPTNDQPTLIGWQTAAETLRRRPTVQAAPEPTMVPQAWLLESPRWTAAFMASECLRRASRAPAVEEAAAPALLWEGAAVALDQQGHAWLVPTPTLLRSRRVPRACADRSATLVLDVSEVMPVPWVPAQGGDWRRIPPRFRATPPDAWAAWIAAGLIVVSGPYYRVAGGLYTAGAVEGDVRSV